MDILDIPKLPQQIKKAAQLEELVVFIGAGMSYELGCVSWDTLANNLINKCEQHTSLNNFEASRLKNMLIQSGNSKKIITICHSILTEAGKEELFMEEMKESLNDGNVEVDNPKLETYRDLFRLNGIFVTTNADRHIDQIFNEQNIIIDNFDRDTSLINKNLYKIHGSITQQSTLIFTVEEYFKRYKDDGFKDFLEALFTKTILFVGYGLGEFELLEYMFKGISQHTNNYFYLAGYYTYDAKICDFEQMYFKQMNVELIPFALDERGFEQLPLVIKEWVKEILTETHTLQNNFDEIDKALQNPIPDSIEAIVQKIKNSPEYEKYFFLNASKYQNLYLWLQVFDRESFFQPQEEMRLYLEFLETVSLQNKENEKEEITQILLKIVNEYLEYRKDNQDSEQVEYFTDYKIIAILFNLPIENIKPSHLDKIYMLLQSSANLSILNSEIEKIILPVLLENKQKRYVLKLLKIIFGYTISQRHSSYQEREPLLDEHWLHSLLEKHSRQIIELVGIQGLKVLIALIKRVLKEDENAFNNIWIATIEKHSQNSFPQRYDNQVVSFTRDLLEHLKADEIRECVRSFLEEKHSIFKRLALHTLNYHYESLKDTFWQWFISEDNTLDAIHKHELYKLLEDRANLFSSDELNIVLNWIENLDYSEYYEDRAPEQFEKIVAYRKKEWLLTIKDYLSEANELYSRYNKIVPNEIEHPGFNGWTYGARVIDYSHIKDDEIFCNLSVDDLVKEITEFDPSTVKNRDSFASDEDLIGGLADDFARCIKQNPMKYTDEIEKFQELEFIYKYHLIYALTNAWREKKDFNWGKVFDFILTMLNNDFFTSDDKYTKWLKGEIASLIQEGTKEDSSAFDKKHLSQAKEVLFLLLKNRDNEEVREYNDLTTYTLNAPDGKILHALVNYSLRYARLHSSQDVKWEDEVKEFFTDELARDDEYSKLVFTILGEYLPNFLFLDKEWVDENFNNIFSKRNETLWEIAISGYFLYSSTVYTDIYKRLKDNGHIEKAIKFDFGKNRVKENVVQHICVMYNSSKDEETLIEVIESKEKTSLLEVIRFMWQVGRDNASNELKQKVLYLWNKIYNLFNEDTTEDAQEIFSTLSKWLVFIDTINEDMMPFLRQTVKYTNKSFNSYFVVEELERLVETNAKFVGELYLEMLKNEHYPDYKQEKIQNTILKLRENGESKNALKIANMYRAKGHYWIKGIDS